MCHRESATSGFGSRQERRRADAFFEDLAGTARFHAQPVPSENEVPEPRLPPRKSDARGGKAFMESIWGTGHPQGADWKKREDAMVAELLSGNIPDFLRSWVTVQVSRNDESPVVTVRVLPDYLCVGSDDDYRHLPLDQQSAQKVADAFVTILPTAKIGHAVWRRTPWSRTIGAIEKDYWQKGPARKVPKGWQQTSTAAYDEHSRAIQARIKEMGITPGRLVAGHKKDVVISSLQDRARITFHGFYKDTTPYEPCFDRKTGGFKPGCNREFPSPAHPEGKGRFSDYSQGVRLVHPFMRIDGVRHLVEDVLKDKKLSKLISAEGTIVPPRVPPPPP